MQHQTRPGSASPKSTQPEKDCQEPQNRTDMTAGQGLKVWSRTGWVDGHLGQGREVWTGEGKPVRHCWNYSAELI